MSELRIEETNWQKAKKLIATANKDLYEVLERWNPDASYPMYIVSYPYGEMILDHGEFRLPLKAGGTVPLKDKSVPEKIRQDLSYSSAPLGVLLDNSCEVFIEIKDRVIPLAMLGMGVPLGLLETLDPINSYCVRNVWSVSAGARSAFMLAKIGEKSAHARLQKEFELSSEPPRQFFDHFYVFRELATSRKLDNNWEVKLLFLSKKFFEEDRDNYGWLLFDNCLQRYMLKYSGYARNKSTFDVLWQMFSDKLNEKKKKPNSYIFERVKHLVAIMIGAAPGYAPVVNDVCGPFKKIQNVYVHDYRIDSAPIIMVPSHFRLDKESTPVYDSLRYSSVFESNPKNRESESLITDLVQIRSLASDFMMLGRSGNFKIENTIIEDTINKVIINYFHSNADGNYTHIKSTKELSLDDSRLTDCKVDGKILKLSDMCSFLRSCIRISSGNP